MGKRLCSVVLLCSIICLYSCQLEEYEVPTDETYTRAFIKQFGVIDSNQDWNMATRGNVVVTTSTPRDIRVYADIDGMYKFVGDKLGLNGTDTVWFDVPKGVTDLIVAADGKALETKVGSIADFAGTRSTFVDNGTSNGGITVEDTDSVFVFDSGTATSWLDLLPEGKYNVGKLTDNYHFYATTKSTLYVYPIFWNTSDVNYNIIGICYEKDGNKVKIPIYQMKKDGILECNKDVSEITYDYSTLKKNIKDLGEVSDNTLSETQKKKISEYLEANDWENVTSIQLSDDNSTVSVSGSQWIAVTTNNTSLQAESSIQEAKNLRSGSSSELKFRSHAIKVEIPENIFYAFYIENSTATTSTNKVFYSYAGWNTAYSGTSAIYSATTGNDDGWRYLAFEDWDEGIRDLNDLVIAIKRPQSTYKIVDDDPNTWLIAAEDMGDIGDFDFNDMVISVSAAITNATTNNKEVTLKAMAAGGTLPLYIYRNGKSITLYETDGTTEAGSIDSENLEFHKWFGDSHESSEMINTTSYSVTGKSYKIILDANETFTMGGTSSGKSIATTDTKNNMGGFSIKVKRSDGDYTTVTAPYKGEAPQMICVPWSWRWPKERVRIDDAYSGFADWCKDNTKTDWYTSEGNVNKDKIVERYNAE